MTPHCGIILPKHFDLACPAYVFIDITGVFVINHLEFPVKIQAVRIVLKKKTVVYNQLCISCDSKYILVHIYEKEL